MMFLNYFVHNILKIKFSIFFLFYTIILVYSNVSLNKFNNLGKTKVESTIRNLAQNMANTKLLKISSNFLENNSLNHKSSKNINIQETLLSAPFSIINSSFNNNNEKDTLNEDSQMSCGSVLISSNGELIYSNKFVENEEQNQLIDKKLIARAKYTKSLNQIGWSKLFIETFDNTTPEVQSWAAGLLEGKLCAEEILDFYSNLVGIHSSELGYLKDVFDFYEKTENFIRSKTSKKELLGLREDDLKYWLSVAMIQAQTDGLLSGYNSMMKNDQFDLSKLYFLNADGEVPELISLFKYRKKLQKQKYQYSFREKKSNLEPNFYSKKFTKEYLQFFYDTSDPEVVWNKFMLKSHCSAVIKLLKNENDDSIKDIMVGHTTWDSYSEMHRIFKIYEFSFTINGSFKKDSKIMFSSYPGTLTSTDDFYVLNNKIVVLETTLEMIDQTVYDKDLPDPANYVPNYIRISVSNRLAESATDWIEYFKKNNSGTYNSQWMILDFSSFYADIRNNLDKDGSFLMNNSLNVDNKIRERSFNIPGIAESFLENFNFREVLKDNNYKEIFFILEQIPGYIEVKDMTDHLFKEGFWASYNRPFFDETSRRAGYTDMAELYGNTYSYNKNPRAKLILSRINEIKDLNDMKKLMQNNRDISSSNFMNTISPRYDLSSRMDLRKPSGGIDSKIVNLELVHQGKVNAISGPSREDGAPEFDWSLWPHEPHHGLPDIWNFDWIMFDENFLKNK